MNLHNDNQQQEFFDFDFSKLAEQMRAGFFKVHPDGSILQANSHFYLITGLQEKDSQKSQKLQDIFNSTEIKNSLTECLQTVSSLERIRAMLQSKEEKEKWVEITLYPLPSERGKSLVFEGFLMDVTRINSLERDENLYEEIYNNTIEGIMITDENTNIVRVNKVFEEITGYHQEEVLGKPPVFLQSGQHDENFYVSLWAAIKHRGKWQGEIRNRRKNGELYSQWLSISTVKNSDGTVRYTGIFTNINVDKEAEKRLSYLAYHDALTGLPNRHLLLDRLEQSLERSHRFENRLAILFLDLDGFKKVNDTYGHFIGDQLLMVVAQRLQKNVRRSDTVARLGGDEFCIVLSSMSREDNIFPVIKHLSEILSKPYLIDNIEIKLTVSIGVSIFPKDGNDPNTLLERADEAMYRVKRKGKNNLGYY